MNVTSLYAALFGLLFVGLSVRTLRLRRRLGVAVGNGDDATLRRAVRVHANFAEYVPLCLLLIGFCEAAGARSAWVHAVCIALLAGRLSHAWGVSQVAETFAFRVFGMAVTLTSIGLASAFLLSRHAGYGGP